MTAVPQQSPESTPPPIGDVAYKWWASLQDNAPNGEPNRLRDRAALARLRRSDPVSCLAEPSVMSLYRDMGGAGFNASRLRNSVRLALVLAHVRRHNAKTTFARALGPSGFSTDDGKLKRIRMQALLKAEGDEEIVRSFRRAIDLLDREANIFDLARVIASWEHERTRMRFAFDYFNAAQAAPGGDD